MDNKNYIKDGKVYNTTFFGRVDVFDIVDEFPEDYEVWPIGRANFPFPGYLPLGRFKDDHMVEGFALKSVRTDESLADEILKHRYGIVDYGKFMKLVKDKCPSGFVC